VTELGKDIDALAIPAVKSCGGTVELRREEILRRSKGDFLQCSLSRHSIRCFSGEPVDLSLINEAVRIAQTTPSVCNRQSSRVYIIQDESSKQAVLERQPGNRGFGHLADKILIVTSDLRAFSGMHERNQAFVDGGMFAMSLLYSLHYLGLGACALSWMVRKDVDEKMRKSLVMEVAD
jgi:nitroreductase